MANETTNHLAGSATFTETISDSSSTQETGNRITGSYQQNITGTLVSRFADAGTNSLGTFQVFESTNGTYTAVKSGSYITGEYELNQHKTTTYALQQLGNSAGDTFALAVAGMTDEDMLEVGNAVTGLYNRTITGTDTYEMTESGINSPLPPGEGPGVRGPEVMGRWFDQTVTGIEIFRLTESGNSATGTFHREIEGAGAYEKRQRGGGIDHPSDRGAWLGKMIGVPYAATRVSLTMGKWRRPDRYSMSISS